MTVEAIAKGVATREIDLRDWGKVMLEEVLFRAAEQVSAGEPGGDGVSVSLSFRLVADRDGNCLEIRTPGAVEGFIVTRLPMPGG
jgi:hypothetical protein